MREGSGTPGRVDCTHTLKKVSLQRKGCDEFRTEHRDANVRKDSFSCGVFVVSFLYHLECVSRLYFCPVWRRCIYVYVNIFSLS